MEHVSEKRFPVNPKDYKLYEEVGEGVSATVYRALCIPYNEIVAIKVLDLEKCSNDLDGIRREVQTMSLIDHPNVLRAHCSFTSDTSLWVVMPYMAGGSCLHIMKSAYPEGFEEPVIATLLREVLKALVYLHNQGHIHRDVKAGNILIDDNGAVKLADFGVSAFIFDTGDRQRSRNTFVGTPCWMAPEVMQQLHGYDFKADIWSFGITALELAHGHAPFSKYPPMKVLLMTLQNAPPGLDYERDKRFSKSFKEMVAACLVKDPKKRPTSEKVLKHHFFKHARSNEFLARTILDGLAPLGERFRALKAKDADFLLQNKAMYGDKEHLSQQEYIRGISGWNFNLEDLKAQAALIESCDSISTIRDLDTNHKPKDKYENANFERLDIKHTEIFNNSKAANMREDELCDHQDLEGSLACSFPVLPLQALKGYFDVREDEISPTTPDWKDAMQSDVSQPDSLGNKNHSDDSSERSLSGSKNMAGSECPKFLSGSILPEHAVSPSSDAVGDIDRDDQEHKFQSGRNYSAPLFYRQNRDAHRHISANSHEVTSEERVVRRKGRFKVTSADAAPKCVRSTNVQGNLVSGVATNSPLNAVSVLPSLQYVLQQNIMQREQLTKLIKSIEQTSGQQTQLVDTKNSELAQPSPASARERELHSYVVHLQQCIADLVEEIERLKKQNAQLERQLNALVNKKEERICEENEA
uniref:Serine/threonine-protein kinase fray2 n=1 Tax=Anthurium amnicola TaxID=1678845 RepID=A0A1D1XK20_9ARAE